MAKTSYAVGLGSNRRHGRYGGPQRVVEAAVQAIGRLGEIEQISTIAATPALGPAGRAFANAAVLIKTDLKPDELLASLKQIERGFGRRRGRRWGPRVLDLDVILWSQGSWAGPGPLIPHPEFRRRRFVLEPIVEIAPQWRDPVTGATMRQLLHRLARPAPVDRVSART
jgi:2-amino-4-hydroxy-6-hydroxymethyldihydropteridine diphosphokinase